MTKIIIALVAVGALIGVWYAVPSFKNNNKNEAYLFVESGNVFTKPNKDANYIALSEKKVLVKNGSYIKTEVGLAHIVFPSNSVISLGENSELEVKYTKNNISISQFIGDTYSRVEKLVSGDTYEVYTSGTLAAVRGTKFAVRYDSKIKKAKVAVTENTVLVSRVAATSSTPTKVTFGMLANVDETINPAKTNESVVVSETKNDTTMNVWIERNLLLDEYIKTDAKRFFEKLIKTEGSGNDINSLRIRLEKAKLLNQVAATVNTDTKKTSLKNLLAMGTSQKCTYSYSANGITSSVDVYLSKGMMRTDSTIIEGGKTMQTHMMLMNEITYIWGDGMPQGMKMSTANQNAPEAQNLSGQAQSVDMTSEMNYACTPWPVESSVFKLPTNIQFIDLSEMMKQAIPTTGSMVR